MSQDSIDLFEDSLPPYQNPPLLPTNESPPIRAEGGRRRHRSRRRGPMKLIQVIEDIYYMIVDIHNEIVSYCTCTIARRM